MIRCTSFAKISSEGNRLPSAMSERKGEEIPILFANPRKDKSALSRNSWIRWRRLLVLNEPSLAESIPFHVGARKSNSAVQTCQSVTKVACC
jgi:hypothetical protein